MSIVDSELGYKVHFDQNIDNWSQGDLGQDFH